MLIMKSMQIAPLAQALGPGNPCAPAQHNRQRLAPHSRLCGSSNMSPQMNDVLSPKPLTLTKYGCQGSQIQTHSNCLLRLLSDCCSPDLLLMAAAPVPFLAGLPGVIALPIAPLPAIPTAEGVTEVSEQIQATAVQIQATLEEMQATAVQIQAMLEQIQATAVQLLASMERLGHLYRVSSHNSMARICNSHAQQGRSALMPLQSEAPEHVSSQAKKP